MELDISSQRKKRVLSVESDEKGIRKSKKYN
jgi:hypothetical protein